MQNILLFPAKVFLLFVFSFVAFWWFMNDGPLPTITLQPLMPSSEVRTFEQAVEESRRRREDLELGIVSMEEPRLEGRVPILMRPILLEFSANQILYADQKNSQNPTGSRGDMFVMKYVATFGLILRTFPDVEMPVTNLATIADVKDAIQSLWLKDIIVLNDFPDESRAWLQTFIRK